MSGIIVRTLRLSGADSPAACVWREIRHGHHDDAIFSTEGWLLPWLDAFAEPPHDALVVTRGQDPVLFLPLHRFADPAGEQRLTLAGAGTTDRIEPLVAADAPTSWIRAALAALEDHGCPVSLPQLRPDGPFARAAASLPGWRIEPGECCVVLDLAGAASLEEALPPGKLRELAYVRRRAARESVRIVEQPEIPLETALEHLFRLHALRWSRRGHPGVLADPRVQRLHRALVRGAAARSIRIRCAVRGDRVIAAHYAVRSGRTEYFYIAGFDPGHAALSPGTLLVGHAIERAIRDGLARFDFMRGGESYKYAWGARDELRVHLATEPGRP